MASSFPSSVDSFPDPLVNSPLNSPSHAGLHTDVNDAVEKLETKVGVGASPASSATAGQVLTATGTGSSWQTPAVTAAQFATVGLVHISTQSFNSIISADFTNVFSSTYDNYRIVFQQYSSTAANEMQFQLRDAGGLVATNNYDSGRIEQLGGVINGFTYTAQSIWTATYVAGSAAGSFVSGTMDVYQPNLVAYTKFTAQMARSDSAIGGIYTVNSQGMFRLTTQMTGFSMLRTGTSTISGIISVFGYRKPS